MEFSFKKLLINGFEINEIFTEFSKTSLDINDFKDELLEILPETYENLTQETLNILKQLKLEPIYSIIDKIWIEKINNNDFDLSMFDDYEINNEDELSSADILLISGNTITPIEDRSLIINSDDKDEDTSDIESTNDYNIKDFLENHIKFDTTIIIDHDGYIVNKYSPDDNSCERIHYKFDKNVIKELHDSGFEFEEFIYSKDAKIIAVYYCNDYQNNILCVFIESKFIGRIELSEETTIENICFDHDYKYLIVNELHGRLRIFDINNNLECIKYPLRNNPRFPERWNDIEIFNFKVKRHDNLSYKLRKWNL